MTDRNPQLAAGLRGTFVAENGASVRGVVLVQHADGRIVLETLPPDPPPVWRAAEMQPVLEAELQERWAWPGEKAARIAAAVVRDLQAKGIVL